MEGVQEDMGESYMQCTTHPFNTTTAAHGGICAFCLQEKLGKLVSSSSSSYPVTVFPSSSSSSSPSFRSDFSVVPAVIANQQTSSARENSSNDCHYHRRSRIPFLLTQKKKKKKDISIINSALDHSNNIFDSASDHKSIVFKRSKSTATHRTGGGHFFGSDYTEDFSSQKRRFWSFFYSSKNSATKKIENPNFKNSFSSSNSNVDLSQQKSAEKKKENESPNLAAFDGKVSRSRSVGCGSRSFSGDFFERISTGLGDCALRRVESQREGKSRVAAARGGAGAGGQDRVKCGGLFSGFMIASSSSSSSSSSYWISVENVNGKGAPAVAGRLAHGRSKSWGWAFASPIRALSNKREATSNKIKNPNLAAIPSLLAVRS